MGLHASGTDSGVEQSLLKEQKRTEAEKQMQPLEQGVSGELDRKSVV